MSVTQSPFVAGQRSTAGYITAGADGTFDDEILPAFGSGGGYTIDEYEVTALGQAAGYILIADSDQADIAAAGSAAAAAVCRIAGISGRVLPSGKAVHLIGKAANDAKVFYTVRYRQHHAGQKT